MSPVKLPPIALFGYDSSTFTLKIRLTLRLLQLPYTFVLVPSMMPRPILVDNFNLTYRKIPVLAIGKDLFIDTSLITEWLHLHPALVAYRDEQIKTGGGHGGQDIHLDTRGRVLSRLLSSHYTDRPLFRLTTGLIPSSVWKSKFGEDRASLIGHKLDPEKLERKIPQNKVGLDTYLSILEPLFANGSNANPWMLGGDKPSAADVSLFYQLQWGEMISRGEGVGYLTHEEAGEGGGEGIGDIFNQDRYPGLFAWYNRFKKYTDDLPNHESRIEKGDAEGVESLMKILEAYERSEDVALLPTPNKRLENLESKIGLNIGSRVSVAPDDTGRDNPTIGKLVALSPEEVVIEPDEIDETGKGRKKARVDGMRLHFPRVGFVVKPAKSSKL